MRIKNICKKLIICMLVFLTLFNFLISPLGKIDEVWAAPSEVTDFENVAESMINTRNNGIAGILSWLLRVIVVGIFGAIQIEQFLIVDSAGNDGTVTSIFVTPLDIFFNRFTLTDINIFTTEGLTEGSLVYDIRVNAALWYNICRAIAIAILLVMLLIIGIKMAMATLAEQKAKVKQLFMDWLISLVLVMFMSLIVILIINVNNQLVNAIKAVAAGTGASDIMNSLMAAAFSDNYLLGMGATITYVLLVLQTFIFIIIYIKRFLVVLFLTIISPLVPLKYSIDKAKGGQSGVLNNWLREYCYNVFIQIIHCIIYVAIIAVPLASLGTSITGLESLAASIILIFSMMFVKKAEELLKDIFGFNKATSLSTYSSTVNNMQNAVMTGVSVANGTYTVTHNTATNQNMFGSNVQTFGEKVSNKIHEYKDKATSYINNYETKPLADGNDLSGNQNKSNDVIDVDWKEVDDGNKNSREEKLEDGPYIPLPSDASPADAGMYARLLEAISSTKNNNVTENNEKLENSNGNENNERLENRTNESVETRTETQEHLETNEHLVTEEHNEREDYKPASNDNKVPGMAGVEFISLNPAIQKAINEFKDEYEKAIAKAQKDMTEHSERLKDIYDEYKNLKDKLEENRADEIENQINKFFADKNFDALEEYISKLEGTEKEFAERAMYLKADEVNSIDDKQQQEDFMRHKLQFAIENGIIDAATGNRLLQNYRNSLRGKNDKTDEIFTEIVKVRRAVISEETELVEKTGTIKTEEHMTDEEIVDLTDDLKLPLSTVNATIKNTRRATMKNSKMLDIINGEISANGDFSDENLMDFNVKILEKARHGAYNESNFEMAERKVREEGDLAVKRLNMFREKQTEENARNLTVAGRKYAQLMIESQQAGMFIVAAGMNGEKNVKSEGTVSNIRTRRGPTNPVSDNTTNILNDLNSRKNKA